MPAIRTTFAFALLLIALVLMWPIVSETNAMDRCSKAGGSYDYMAGSCDFKATHPIPGLWQRHGVALFESIALGWVGCALLLRSKR